MLVVVTEPQNTNVRNAETEVLDDLIANGTYMSQQLYQQALAAVGE